MAVAVGATPPHDAEVAIPGRCPRAHVVLAGVVDAAVLRVALVDGVDVDEQCPLLVIEADDVFHPQAAGSIKARAINPATTMMVTEAIMAMATLAGSMFILGSLPFAAVLSGFCGHASRFRFSAWC